MKSRIITAKICSAQFWKAEFWSHIENCFCRFRYLFYLFIFYIFYYCQKGHTYSNVHVDWPLIKGREEMKIHRAKWHFHTTLSPFPVPRTIEFQFNKTYLHQTIFALESCKTNLGQHVTRAGSSNIHWVIRFHAVKS